LGVLGLAVFDGLPFLAPLLMHAGMTGPGNAIYTVYGLTCHQLAYRTFFFFGAQPFYTIDQLHALLPGAQDVPALSFFWRDFRGDALLGYKMAWCERDAAIYTSMLAGSLLFGLVRARLKPLDWRAYLILITPLAIDGLTQLTGLRESDAALRVITGVLFGGGSIWLIYPYLEAAMIDMRTQALDQFERARLHAAMQDPSR
ncbi:MAG: DUF2085 domain-containing protein, partial [Chloroflexi bacterium]|nr:DUF2085 domain-containing protein [Chloroflexota bacterium]